MYVTPGPDPIGESRGDDASLGIKQRERKKLSDFWQLLFCRLFNESALPTPRPAILQSDRLSKPDIPR